MTEAAQRQVQERLNALGFRGTFSCEMGGGTIWVQGRTSAAELRSLANAIDGQDDANLAMFRDLKEENTAFQLGVEEGMRRAMEQVECDGCEGTGLVETTEGPYTLLVLCKKCRGSRTIYRGELSSHDESK